MRRTLTVAGVAMITVLGAVAASQAQGPGAQREDRPAIGRGPGFGMDPFECGPRRGMNGPGQGLQPGRGLRGPQGAMLGRGPGRMSGRGFALCGLDLTDDQKTRIKAIHQETRQEIEALLTPEQKAKLQARRSRTQ